MPSGTASGNFANSASTPARNVRRLNSLLNAIRSAASAVYNVTICGSTLSNWRSLRGYVN